METFWALLAIGEGNSSGIGEFPAQRPVTPSFDVFFDLRPNKRLSKQPWGWWFETPSGPLWRHCKLSMAVDMRLRTSSPLVQPNARWRHPIETFSLLALCEGNPPVIGGFPAQRPVTRSFDAFFDLRLNNRLSKPSRRRWFVTPSCSLWHHCNDVHSQWGTSWQIYFSCVLGKFSTTGVNIAERHVLSIDALFSFFLYLFEVVDYKKKVCACPNYHPLSPKIKELINTRSGSAIVEIHGRIVSIYQSFHWYFMLRDSVNFLYCLKSLAV